MLGEGWCGWVGGWSGRGRGGELRLWLKGGGGGGGGRG